MDKSLEETKFIKQIQDDIKKYKQAYVKALPSDILVYEINQDKNEALISWRSKEKRWFSLDKIIFASLSWARRTSNPKEIYTDQFFREFQNLIKSKTK